MREYIHASLAIRRKLEQSDEGATRDKSRGITTSPRHSSAADRVATCPRSVYGEAVHVEAATKPRAVSNIGRRPRRRAPSLLLPPSGGRTRARASFLPPSLSAASPTPPPALACATLQSDYRSSNMNSRGRPSPCNVAPRGRERFIKGAKSGL